jgi:hypothetical protein
MGLGFSESLLDTHTYNHYRLQYHSTSGPILNTHIRRFNCSRPWLDPNCLRWRLFPDCVLRRLFPDWLFECIIFLYQLPLLRIEPSVVTVKTSVRITIPRLLLLMQRSVLAFHGSRPSGYQTRDIIFPVDYFVNSSRNYFPNSPRMYAFFFQRLFQPIQGLAFLFSSVIIFHRRYDSLNDLSARRKAAT